MSHLVFCGVILEKLTARNRGDRTQHRVDRVLGFFSSRPNSDPLTRGRICSPPLFPGGGDTHACGIGGVPIRTRRQTLWYSRYTVTRPYAGFRHPDRMAPDQTVRGGENDHPILSGNLLPKVPKFSVINRSFP
jgi:hypothetical protein